MGIKELNIDLTDEHRSIMDTVTKFGREVMRPVSIELDQMPTPEDVIAEDSVLWDAMRKYREIGLHIPSAEADVLGNTLISEIMGYWAPGLAISLGVSGMPFNPLLQLMSQDPEIQKLPELYANDLECKMIGCWGVTEPDHGSDWIMVVSESAGNPSMAANVRAEKDGDSYVLNGQKAAWVSNGTIATHSSLHVCLDPSRGMAGTGLAMVPLDLPGISKGKPLNKIGQRDLNQGEIFFDNVRIPESMMVVQDPDAGSALLTNILTLANTSMATTFTGLGHAAFDEALAYAKERIQGGKPIIEHQNIKLKLFDMFTAVEASRSLARRVAVSNSVEPKLEYAVAAKVLATDTAFKVASEAIQVFGGNGLSKEYHIEQIFRDARASMIEDGVNETLALGAAERL
jgi:alkylation response protein AidB-like acyl-CoA dehydrogenase